MRVTCKLPSVQLQRIVAGGVWARESTAPAQGNQSLSRELREVLWAQAWTQLWMCLVVKVKSDAVKNNIA